MKARVLDFLIKLVLLCAVGAVFYFQIFQKEEINEVQALFLERLRSTSPILLILAMLLVPVNWALETKKWLSLLGVFYKSSFGKAYQAVLSGVTVSLITPNRIGEYGGRVVFIPDGFRWQATISTLVGSLAQLISLLGFGMIAALALTISKYDLSNLLLAAYLCLSTLLMVLLLLIYFNLPLVIKVARKLPFWEKWKRYFSPLKAIQKFPTSQLKIALFFASLRYLVYFFQYYLLAQYFGIQTNIWESFIVIGTIFLVQTSIPLPPIWSLLVRGQAALYFWGFFAADPLQILASTFALWIINLIIPALIGLIFLVKTNIPKNLGYEKK